MSCYFKLKGGGVSGFATLNLKDGGVMGPGVCYSKMKGGLELTEMFYFKHYVHSP